MGGATSIFWKNSTSWSAEGKHVLITGASSGIGSEMARNFAKAGASVALLARSKEGLSAVAEECRQLQSEFLGARTSSSSSTTTTTRAEIYPCDMTNDSQIKDATAKALEQFGRFDVLILNAGRSQGCYFEEIKDMEHINYMLKLNVNGVINTLYHLLPSVPKSSSSRIVIISSVAGLIPVPYRTVYCASKHALNGFANALRMELNDTHGNESAPVVQVINFPEVKGTKLNTGRMDFGADEPPMNYDTANVATVEEACSSLMEKIVEGVRDWGQPLKVSILLPLSSIFPNFLEKIIMKTVKKKHHRPTE